MANTIRIKRSTGTAAPSTLANAELAYSEGGDSLYIGVGTGGENGSATTVRQIGSHGLFSAKNAGTFYAGPSAGDVPTGAPSFRAIVSSDLPAHSHAISDVTDLATSLAAKAALAGDNTFTGSNTFSGTTNSFSSAATFSGSVSLGASATATTPATNDSSTAVATTAYVKNQGYLETAGGTVTGSLTVSGNLTVNGTTTTVNSTVTTLTDPVITLGGSAAPTTDDGKDRGVEFRWHDGTVAKVGFFGFSDATGKFTFLPEATNASESFSGSLGTIDVGAVHINGNAFGVDNLAGLGTGVATFLATPSSANLAAALTDETGSTNGKVVFSQSPSLEQSVLVTRTVAEADGSNVLQVNINATGGGGQSALFAVQDTGAASLAGKLSAAATLVTDGYEFNAAAAVTAGSNALGQSPLTKEVSVITTAAAEPSGVTLVAASAGRGRRMTIINRALNSVNVYPSAGGTIDYLNTNTPYNIPAGAQATFFGTGSNKWYSIGHTAILQSAKFTGGSIDDVTIDGGTY